ncbi:MAG: sodium:calcium antiporter [Candidatus Paceibacterota bacterium]|jgi:cation:H+ antiporter
MIALFYILAVIVCCVLLFLSAELLIGAINRIAKFLGLKEFVVAFFVMAVAGSLPNLFVDVSAALRGMPELAFGEVVGGNVFDLTVTAALAVLFSRNGIPARGGTIQTSAIFTIISAILPLALIIDGNLSQIDGMILISFFIFYIIWLFSKKERFTKIYDGQEKLSPLKAFKVFIADLGKVILGLISLLIASNLIVEAVSDFSSQFNFPVALIGVLIVGLGNSLPELYFSTTSARKGETSLIFGDLMGAVIIPATLVLGIVALIRPFSISDFSLYALARTAMLISALLFLVFIRTDRRITKKEAVGLLAVYVIWLLAEVFKNYRA